MKVIFVEDMPGVARAGEVKEVKTGFARNYLIPRNIATAVTHDQMQRIENLRKAAQQRRDLEAVEWREVGESLEGVTVTLQMRSGATGRLYGSVTNGIIAEELSKLCGREINRRGVTLEGPIRSLGTYEVPVELHPGVDVTINLLVEAEVT